MRSIAIELNLVYNEWPFPNNFHQQSSFTLEVGFEGLVITYVLVGVIVEGQYAKHLNWFAIDLKDEKSAMDGRIFKELQKT